jgi:serine/threonine protein kinase
VFSDSIIGLAFMHVNKIAHRDIKPANIMMFADGKYALADYGVGKNLQQREEYSRKENISFQVGNW